MSSKRALVVEDEPHLRLLVERVLGRAGYDVVSVGTIDEATPWLDSVDVLIVDYFLGPERGPDLVRRAREELGVFAPPAMLMTGTPDAVSEDEWPLFVSSLTKPFRVHDLVEQVDRLVGDRPRARSATVMKAVVPGSTQNNGSAEKKTQAG